MRTSRVLKKIRQGKVARLCALASYLPYFPTVAAQKFNKPWGTPVATEADLELTLRAGARFVVYGAEVRLIRAGLKQCGETLDGILNE